MLRKLHVDHLCLTTQYSLLESWVTKFYSFQKLAKTSLGLYPVGLSLVYLVQLPGCVNDMLQQ